MLKAEDLCFDSVSQVHMPGCWSSGRVVLCGDAAHATSFLSGQGSSLALIGAYILAGELASHADPQDAFLSYEKICRPFMEANQALVAGGKSVMLPATAEEVNLRNQALRSASQTDKPTPRGTSRTQVHSAIDLPDYGWLLAKKSSKV